MLRELIRAGEGARVEFKSSLRFDVHTEELNRGLAKLVSKGVAGLLNAEGGMLLIGVSDDGTILGIESDMGLLGRQNVDGFEQTLRNILGNHLGLDVSPRVGVTFVKIDGHTVSCISCERHRSPVFLQDGDRQEFYVRDGNQTRPMDVRSTHEYIAAQWPSPEGPSLEDIKVAMREALEERASSAPPIPPKSESLPPWIKVATRRVVDLFLSTLAGSNGWTRLYIISPWISQFDAAATLSFGQLLKRLERDRTTAYIVTRPPEEQWHKRAVELLGNTRRANIALVPDLHVKLYTAHTDEGAFAMLGSANFTQQSLTNREIGVLVSAYSDGKRVFSQLDYEAAQIYRSPGRRLIYQSAF
jgi:hypothetical protein